MKHSENFFLQIAQKGLEARRARIEQRSVLKTYVSSEIRSATQNMSLFEQSVKAIVCGACMISHPYTTSRFPMPPCPDKIP
jgi:hypothetical protein